MKRFDRKFGAEFLAETPTTPAVYLFYDELDQVLYVGKAKNARRRLAQYRNANRRKAQRKMRLLVREAARLEVRPQGSEREALLEENRLIRELRPRFNVEGAFDFLYPAIGIGWHEERLVLVFTTDPDAYDEIELTWHGTFRPRWRARDAFEGLAMLLGHLGHAEPRSRLPVLPDRRGARVLALRRVPRELLDWTRAFLDGEASPLVPELAARLLESQAARQSAAEIEVHLKFLADFQVADAERLRGARLACGRRETFVPGWLRDELFIRERHAEAGSEPASEEQDV